MSYIAFKDKAKKYRISIEEAVYEDNEHYYCLNNKCDAILYIRNSDGIKSAHFCAYAKNPHISGCYAGKTNFKLDEFKEDEFNFVDTLSNLSNFEEKRIQIKTRLNVAKTDNQNISAFRPLRTLREIYLMCKSKEITDEYANVKISKMIADDRTKFIYGKYGPIGTRIVECGYKRYDSNESKIFVDYYGRELSLKLKDDLFSKVNDKLYKNKVYKIAIGGKWNFCTATITSEKQIYIIK